MGVVPVPHPQVLSWSSARLLALLLNSLSGFLDHLEGQRDQLVTAGEWDTLLGMRLVQDHLLALDRQFHDRGFHPAIFQAIRNLSAQNELLLRDRLERARITDPEVFGQLSPIFTGKRTSFGEHKLVEEGKRWEDKEQKERRAGEEVGTRIREQLWIDAGGRATERRCLSQLFSPSNCTFSADCVALFSVRGQVGSDLTRPLLFFQLISDRFQSDQCPFRSLSDNSSIVSILANPSEFVAEACANMLDELKVPMQRNRKLLGRLRADTLGLLLEQVFLCGHRGFVQFAVPHLLPLVLSWQHPQLGCWTAQKADSVPSLGIKAAMEFDRIRGGGGGGGEARAKEQRTSGEDVCLPHLSAVSALALCSVYLRFLLDPGPWPEHALADELVQMDGVPAEDKFRQFAYLKWVRDLPAEPAGLRLLRPPSSSWSPDLVAFVCLLFFVLLVLVLFVHFCGDEHPTGPAGAKRGGLRKKMYPYAFKKL